MDRRTFPVRRVHGMPMHRPRSGPRSSGPERAICGQGAKSHPIARGWNVAVVGELVLATDGRPRWPGRRPGCGCRACWSCRAAREADDDVRIRARSDCGHMDSRTRHCCGLRDEGVGRRLVGSSDGALWHQRKQAFRPPDNPTTTVAFKWTGIVERGWMVASEQVSAWASRSRRHRERNRHLDVRACWFSCASRTRVPRRPGKGAPCDRAGQDSSPRA